MEKKGQCNSEGGQVQEIFGDMACPSLDPTEAAFAYPTMKMEQGGEGSKRHWHETKDPHPLDPIEVAGCINLGRLLEMATREEEVGRLKVENLIMLTRIKDSSFMEWAVEQPTVETDPIISNSRYGTHGRYLRQTGYSCKQQQQKQKNGQVTHRSQRRKRTTAPS
jgi:hypothetical protein